MQIGNADRNVQFFLKDLPDFAAALALFAVLELKQPVRAFCKLRGRDVEFVLLGNVAKQRIDLIVDQPRQSGRLLRKRLFTVIPRLLSADLHRQFAGQLNARRILQPETARPIRQPLDADAVRDGVEIIVAGNGQRAGKVQVRVGRGVLDPAARRVLLNLRRRIVDEIVVRRPVGDALVDGDLALHQPGEPRRHLEHGAGHRSDRDRAVQRRLIALRAEQQFVFVRIDAVGEQVRIIIGIRSHRKDLPGMDVHHDDRAAVGLFDRIEIVHAAVIGRRVFGDLFLFLLPRRLDVVDQRLFDDLLQLHVDRGLHIQAVLRLRRGKHLEDRAAAVFQDRRRAEPSVQVRGQVRLHRLFHARDADQVAVGIPELQHVLRFLDVHKPAIIVERIVDRAHIRRNLFGKVAEDVRGMVAVRINAHARLLGADADQLARLHIELGDHRQGNAVRDRDAFERAIAVQNGLLPDRHDLARLIERHIVRNAPGFAQDPVRFLGGKIGVGEIACLDEILFADGRCRFAARAEIVNERSVRLHADIERVNDFAAARLDDPDRLDQRMRIAHAVHRRRVVRVAVEAHVVRHLVIGEHDAVAVENLSARTGLIGHGARRLRNGGGVRLDLGDRELADKEEQHKQHRQKCGDEDPYAKIQFSLCAGSHIRSRCPFLDQSNSLRNGRTHSPVATAHGKTTVSSVFNPPYCAPRK